MFVKLALLVSIALTQVALAAQPVKVEMLQLVFEEREPGVATYTTRMLLDRRFLRIDSGADEDDYVLFDRVMGEIHNFNHEDRSEIVIQRRPAIALESEYELASEQSMLTDMPTIAGIQGRSNLYFANGKLCRTSVSFPGLMDSAVRTLGQYEQLLQQQNRQTLKQLPRDLRTPCYMANNYLAAEAYLEDGFPVHLVDFTGREKRLVGFSNVSKPVSLLRRMPGYRVFYPSLPPR